MNQQDGQLWKEAKRRCRLSDEDVAMARELGMRPKSLLRNIPTPAEPWKAPVKEWVRSLHAERFGFRDKPAPPPILPAAIPRVIEFRDPAHPWPDKPVIPDIVIDDDEFPEEDDEVEDLFDTFEPPDDREIEDQNSYQLRRQALYRWAAQWIAIVFSGMPEVERVAAFGAVSQPLEKEVPRFAQFRRHRIRILHECADIDLAVWLNRFDQLNLLRKRMSQSLSFTQDTPYGGVAHHQVDVHLLDAESGDYRGRLCGFAMCPKPGKRECHVPGCGSQAFLRQFAQYRFNEQRFAAAPKVTLFDRAKGFLVREPVMDAKPTIMKASGRDRGVDDTDVPF